MLHKHNVYAVYHIQLLAEMFRKLKYTISTTDYLLVFLWQGTI